MRVAKRLPVFLLVLTLFAGCSATFKSVIRDSFDAAQVIASEGDSVIKSVCLDLARVCIADGKRREQCAPFLQCEKAHYIFLNASQAGVTALSLAEAARVSGDEKRARELFEAAHRALKVAQDILSQFIGVDEEVQP